MEVRWRKRWDTPFYAEETSDLPRGDGGLCFVGCQGEFESLGDCQPGYQLLDAPAHIIILVNEQLRDLDLFQRVSARVSICMEDLYMPQDKRTVHAK